MIVFETRSWGRYTCSQMESPFTSFDFGSRLHSAFDYALSLNIEFTSYLSFDFAGLS